MENNENVINENRNTDRDMLVIKMAFDLSRSVSTKLSESESQTVNKPESSDLK